MYSRRRNLVNVLAALVFAFTTAATTLCGAAGEGTSNGNDRLSFSAFDLWIDSGNDALAAYQVEITYDQSIVKIVGLEGGHAVSYTNAPYYDQRGFESGRIILAAFTTGTDTPKGKVMVARIHMAVKGTVKPELICELMTAAKPDGGKIHPGVELAPASHEKERKHSIKQ